MLKNILRTTLIALPALIAVMGMLLMALGALLMTGVTKFFPPEEYQVEWLTEILTGE